MSGAAFTYSLLTMLFWGLVGVMRRKMDPQVSMSEGYVWYALVSICAGIIFNRIADHSWFFTSLHWSWWNLGFAGVWTAGGLCLMLAMRAAPNALPQINSISGLFPIVTALIVFAAFGDHLSARQWFGVCASAAGVWLVSGK